MFVLSNGLHPKDSHILHIINNEHSLTCSWLCDLSIEANYAWYCLFMHVMPPTEDTSVGVPSVCFKPITNLNLHSQSLLFPCYCFDCFYWQPWLFDIYLFATLCTMQWRNKRSDWDQNENWEIALVASTNMLHAKYNVHAH